MEASVVMATQIGTLLVFVGAVFLLYRLLVQQKDAHITLLRERNSQLEHRLENESQDALADSLSGRVSHLTDELQRLREDKETNSALINAKEEELEQAKSMYQRIRETVMHASGLSVSFFCPECDEPTITRAEAKVEFGHRENDQFTVYYSCGRREVNGAVVDFCRGSSSNK